MKFYLASRYSRRVELAGYAKELVDLGHEVTSRWLLGLHEIPGKNEVRDYTRSERALFATEDLEDVLKADCVISFTEPHGSPFSRGGRHVEFGYALASGKKCVVIEHFENVFHCLPNVMVYSTWGAFFKWLVPSVVTDKETNDTDIRVPAAAE